MTKKIVSDLDLKGKVVLERADFNVPIKDGEITNDNRIVQALPTIKYIIEQGGKLVLFSHLGKVKEESDKEGLTLKPVADNLSKQLGKKVTFVPETRGEKLESAIKNLNEGDVLLVENTRFEDLDGKKESKNDPELGKYWASLGDVFVNDAFGTAHREHASNVGISTHLETAAGYLMEKEIKFIGGVVNDPHKPVVAILGGAKVSDKINVIKNLVNIADKILIGGGMAYTFAKAQGKEIGLSLLEEDKIDFAKDLLANNSDQIVLPVDCKVAKEFLNDAKITEVSIDEIPSDQEAMDIGSKTVELFNKELQGAHTVVWNGPMGVFEFSNFAKGTIGVCESIAKLNDATTIIGGGDSAAAAISLGFKDDFTHISTGGGASLEYLEGKELPGIKAINNK
ncbi:phosphoglycerate kinase [Staphylococcus saccharolyticus]|uniref:Phosphoglycerate kinase n=1 Tax=Staphylococcus saccharolyticus TaxID=33028 RepID=A0A380H6Y5_9STAP|nr:phosphoglycerate kinase [Staphylococcus saccharolyticus]MBL7565712.1 phosphoglycerate kinase [Staphylococcus saccharolyticus]MBL7572206.1 phosphoglycerate kinase [Staphylococcus saccharolyticus]QQB97758.1 phosphoglycerate kinase [Staphylococcus saccharolyticus]QRJ66386.1 phosphoglycerate kinase [Staphylococcus saccharolyticus]RTX96144.1 phosphoglycerate kinase [Staphylococcus saccharolyticus]